MAKNQIKNQKIKQKSTKNPIETQNRVLLALRNVREEEDGVNAAEEEND